MSGRQSRVCQSVPQQETWLRRVIVGLFNCHCRGTDSRRWASFVTVASEADPRSCARDPRSLALAGDELAEMSHSLAGSAGLFGLLRPADLVCRFEWAAPCRSAETPALTEHRKSWVTVPSTVMTFFRGDVEAWPF